ncbi:MAG: DNA mismatch repair endonuclease MutL [Planctomycetota bacterium]
MSPTTTDSVIRRLPPLLVNQIAAGEVIERPASIVKELVENALDAGATRIRVELERGGIELVRVTDDGKGMGSIDLPLALAPHATSKIARPEDLDRIGTLGFRGEAIASIASVSRVRIRSRRSGADGANEIEGADGNVGEVKPAPGPVGTSIEARNLFYNTPARRKFLKTPQTEKQRCMEWLRDLALAHPAIGFTCLNDGREAMNVPPGQGPKERALAIVGTELEGEMVEVHADDLDDGRGVSLWGLAGLPSLARPTAKAQHVFLNGRTIRDKVVQHAIREAYRGLIEPGRHPSAVLMLEVPPDAVDVNVHPAKLEVRFRDRSLVHQVVLRAIRRGLERADLTPDTVATGFDGRFEGTSILPPTYRPPLDEPGVVDARAFADSIKEVLAKPTNEPLTYDRVQEALDEQAKKAFERRVEDMRTRAGGEPFEQPGVSQPQVPMPRVADRVLQVHNSYLLTQDARGVVIVDQHALHERVMFEKLFKRVLGEARPLESQPLLTPAAIEVSPAQAELVGSLGDLLAKIGIEAEAFGPASVGVRAFPTFLFERGVDPADFIPELLDKLEREGSSPTAEEALRDVLDMMACKAAVKAGDRMSQSELEELMQLREEVERSSNCPHGRPTSIRLTIAELEKLFGRR